MHGRGAEGGTVLPRVPARQSFLRAVRRIWVPTHSSVSAVAGLERRRTDVRPVNSTDSYVRQDGQVEFYGCGILAAAAAAAAAESRQHAAAEWRWRQVAAVRCSKNLDIRRGWSTECHAALDGKLLRRTWLREFITLRAKLSGAVYCYRSCLCVCNGRAVCVCGCVCVCVCVSVTTITRNCINRSSPNWVYV